MPRLERQRDFPKACVSTGSMAENKTFSWRVLKPILDAKRCTGCQICWKFCPDDCVSMVDGKPVFDLDHCKGCGICVVECPPKCLSMVEEASL